MVGRNKGKRSNARRVPKASSGSIEHENEGESFSVALPTAPSPSLPRCVLQLMNSKHYGELEESCGDVGVYATDYRHFGSLVAARVPERLAELLSFLPLDASGNGSPFLTAAENATETTGSPLQKLHQGIIRCQTAAAGALRNFITHSSADEVVDALTSGCYTAANGERISYSAVLLTHVFGCWSLINDVRAYVPLDDHLLATCSDEVEEDIEAVEMEDSTTENPLSRIEERQVRRAIRLYFSLLLLQEQIYQLALISVDGSEDVANDFSQPRVVSEVLRQLEVCMTKTESILAHTPSVFAVSEVVTNDTPNKGGRFYFHRREALLLTNLATAAGDMLQTLSTDNPLLVSSFFNVVTDGESGVTAIQRTWLDSIVQATTPLSWINSQSPAISFESLGEGETTITDERSVSGGTSRPSYWERLVELQKDFVYLQMLRFTLSIQGMLFNLSPSSENMSRVLPLTVQVLSTFMPIQQWRQVLPLLEESCAVPEGIRNMVVRMTTNRLRSAKAAIDILHCCVTFIGEQNDESLDDETAFTKNPLSSLLYQHNALHVVGLVLKDALWMTEFTDAKNIDILLQSEQRALRLSAASNSEVTMMQYVILSTEVGIWQLGNTLLLMVSPASLGELSIIWRAMLSAVRYRTELLSDAALHAATSTEDGSSSSMGQSEAYEAVAKVYTIACESPAARHLLWLQLKSLVEILWIVVRKQSAVQGSYLDCSNTLGAEPIHMDLLTRLVWEKDCPYSVAQACVATVGFLAASFQDVASVTAAASSAQALLTRSGGALSISDLEGGVMQASPPTATRERHAWLSRLQRVDEVVSVRCEAANTLIDLFSDERYDQQVYLPLCLQRALQMFFQQLRPHIAAREQITKFLWKNYHVKLSPPRGSTLWAEVKDNLEGFLVYKRTHAKA